MKSPNLLPFIHGRDLMVIRSTRKYLYGVVPVGLLLKLVKLTCCTCMDHMTSITRLEFAAARVMNRDLLKISA